MPLKCFCIVGKKCGRQVDWWAPQCPAGHKLGWDTIYCDGCDGAEIDASDLDIERKKCLVCCKRLASGRVKLSGVAVHPYEH